MVNLELTRMVFFNQGGKLKMNNIRIVAESGADISPELAAEYGITIVPMHVIFDGNSREDGSFDPQAVVDYYRKTGRVPKTSAAMPADFSGVFDRIHEESPDAQILYLGYSAVTTSSYANATLAAEGRDYVTPVDTKQCTAGQCAAVIRTAQLIRLHPDWDVHKVAEEARRICDKTHVSFVPQNLDFLKAGGRCSNSKALLANLLHIVPLIDVINGNLLATDRYRGTFTRVIRKMIREYTEKYHFSRDVLYIGTAPGFTDEWAQEVRSTCESLGFHNLIWLHVGCVITTHGGPGAYCIAGFEDA